MLLSLNFPYITANEESGSFSVQSLIPSRSQGPLLAAFHLTHGGRDKMVTMSQKTFLNVFSCFKAVVFWWRPRQNGFHIAENVFECVFLYQNCILIWISLKFVPKGPTNNKPAVVQIMVWCLTCNKLLPKTMLVQFTDAYMWCNSA